MEKQGRRGPWVSVVGRGYKKHKTNDATKAKVWRIGFMQSLL